MILIKNANVYSPDSLGYKDVLIGGGKILAIDSKIESHRSFSVFNA